MALKKNFVFNTEVWIYPGDSAWHFVTLPGGVSKSIRSVFTKGFVKIEATIKNSTWKTSLFPHKLSRGYILCINKKIRQKENIYAEDQVKVSIKIL